MVSLDSIKNFIQLTEQIGTAGQPQPGEFRKIHEAGYRHVINLAMPDHPKAVPGEAQIVTELGMTYKAIPVPFDSPLPAHVLEFSEYMQVKESKPVFVHCIMNFRASAFLYLYLKNVKNVPESEARSIMFDHWEPDATWQALLKWNNTTIGWPA